MFWIFTAFVGSMFFAVTLGQYSVWFGLLRVAMMAALVVIAVMGAALILQRFKKN